MQGPLEASAGKTQEAFDMGLVAFRGGLLHLVNKSIQSVKLDGIGLPCAEIPQGQSQMIRDRLSNAILGGGDKTSRDGTRVGEGYRQSISQIRGVALR